MLTLLLLCMLTTPQSRKKLNSQRKKYIYYDNNLLKSVDSEKCLGVKIEKHLTWKELILTFSVLSVICVATSCLSTMLWVTYLDIPCAISMCYQRHIKHRGKDFYTAFDEVNVAIDREWGCECCHFQYIFRTFCGVWMMCLLK